MSSTIPVTSKLPDIGVSIFAVMTRLANEHGAINLSQGFPDYNCDPELIEAVARYMREGHNQYAPMPGVLALREALTMKIERLYGRRYDPATEMTVTTVRYPDYRIDWDDVRRKVSRRTRAIVVNTPHNPTGMIWTADDIAELRRVLQGTDAVVISDEVYEHITFDGHRHESLARYPDIAERAIVISSFGKTYHTTGWKVGYCAASPELTREIQGIHQWVTFAVNGAVQMAYADMVNRDPSAADVTAFYQGRRDLFLSLIAGSRFKPLPCRGTFFQLVDYSAITAEHDVEFAQRLTREHGVAAIPISPFLNENEQPGPVVRFCFAKRDETLQKAAERLRGV